MPRKYLLFFLLFLLGKSVYSKDTVSFWKSSSYEREILDDGRIRLYSEVDVLGESKTVEVLFTSDVETFAPTILENAKRIIPAIANYLKMAPAKDRFTITHLGDKSVARNEGYTVLVPFNYPDPKAALPVPLLFHEIDHWWFGHNPRFISEGVSSFLPIALEKAGHLKLSKEEILEIENWWGFYVPKIIKDRPLGDEEIKITNEEESFSLFYQKTFKIQYIIYNELGAEGYLKFLKSMKEETAIDENFMPSREEAMTTNGIFQLLEEVTAKNWRKILSGWLASKTYSGVNITEWQDSDTDGLLDVEERYLGTNIKSKDSDQDGLHDGAEVSIGTSPLTKNTKSEFEEALEKSGPILDGNESDWKFLKNQKTVNSLPNSKIPGIYDMIEFSYVWIGDSLYGKIKTREAPLFSSANKGYYYFIVDSSENPVTEGFGFWYANDSKIGWEIRKNNPPEMVYGKVGEVFEFKIKIPKTDPKPKKYIPLIRKKENYGIWNNYSPIQIEK